MLLGPTGCGLLYSVDGLSGSAESPSLDPPGETVPNDASRVDATRATLPGRHADGGGAWCLPASDTVFVHGTQGNDENEGTCENPVRSVTRANEIANSLGPIAIIRIAGGTDRALLLYTAQATGEVFPIRFTKGGLSVVGDGADLVSIRGSGNDGFDGECAVRTDANMAIEGINIRGMTDDGIRVSSGRLTLRQSSVTDSPGHGLEVAGGDVIITESALSRNGLGLVSNSYGIQIERSTIADSKGAGMFLYNEGYVVSRSTKYSRNGMSGIALAHNANLSSSGDIFEGNRDGLTMGDPANSGTGAEVTDSQFINHLLSGLSMSHMFRVKLRGCTIVGNKGNGINVGNPPYAGSFLDLGSAQDPGRNILQRASGGNAGAGVCNQSSLTVSASGNQFRNCPVGTSQACSGGVDIVGKVTASCL